MIPGPVTVEGDVLAELARPVRPHYGTDWAEDYHRIAHATGRVFGSRTPATLLFGPGMAAVEASITSLLAPGDEILIPTSGWFAERMIPIADAAGLVVRTCPTPPLGAPIDVGDVGEALKAHPRVRALAIVHHETMLGLVNPLRELCDVARERDVLLIVDAISSLGGIDVRVDEWGIDICVAVGNKCIGGPVGIAPLVVGRRAWEAILDGRSKRAGWYLDLRTWRQAEAERGDTHPHPTTMPTGTIYALGVAVDRVLAVGLATMYERHASTARLARQGFRNLGFELLISDEHASPVTTSVVAPSWMVVGDFISWLRRNYGLRISGVYGELEGKVFRIGHMGQAAAPEALEALLEATAEYARQEGARPDRRRPSARPRW